MTDNLGYLDIFGYGVSWGSCGRYIFTPKRNGYFALRGPMNTAAMRTVCTMMATSTTAAAVWIGLPAGGALRGLMMKNIIVRAVYNQMVITTLNILVGIPAVELSGSWRQQLCVLRVFRWCRQPLQRSQCGFEFLRDVFHSK